MLQKAQAEKKYNYQLRFYDSGPMAIEDLLNGRIDAIGLDAAPAEDAMRKGKPVQEVGVFVPTSSAWPSARTTPKP